MFDRRTVPLSRTAAYRDDIDGLRAVSVLLIVLFHAGVTALSGGFTGVDVFFVISGYLITGQIAAEIDEGRFALGAFYMRRLRRLAPSFIVVLLASLAAGYLILSPMLYEDMAESAIAALLSVSNIWFWTQAGYFDTEAIQKPLLHTWSLGVEEQFYLFWPILLLVLLRLRGRRGAVAGLTVLSVLSLVAAELTLSRDASAAFYFSPFRIAEFACGAVLALLPGIGSRIAGSAVASVGGLGIILASGLLYDETTRFPGIAAMGPCLGAALLIAAGPQALGNRWLSAGWLRYVGRISYALYLVHWPIVSFYTMSVSGPDTAWEIALLVAASIASAAVLYHLVETPFRSRSPAGHAIGSRTVRRAGMAGAALVLAGAISVDRSDGALFRLPPDMLHIVSALDAAKGVRDRIIPRDGCHFRQGDPDAWFAKVEDCLPENPEKAIVIFGDSHAADVWMGLRKRFPDSRTILATGAGCAMGRGAISDNCRRFHETVLDWMDRNRGSFAAILYSQRGSFGLTGYPWADMQVAPTAAPDDAALAALGDAMRRLADLSVPVWLIGPRPEYFPRVDVLASRFVTVDALNAGAAAISQASYKALDSAFADIAADANVRFISALDALCRPDCTPVTDAGDPLVLDKSHWTLPGAAHAVGAFADADPALAAILAE